MISFCIVNWNGGAIFKQCLESIQKNCERVHIEKYEIVVVDNGSSDLKEEEFQGLKNLRIIKNLDNKGFAEGTNQSVKESNGEILFLLNNDVILKEGSLGPLLEKVQEGEWDAVVPRILYPDGRLQKSITALPTLKDIFLVASGLSFLRKKWDSWLLSHFDYAVSREIHEQPMFSALVIKKSAWEKTGPLDLNFPYLWNDVDWFYRFYSKNQKCFYCADSEVFHIHGMSINKNRFKKVIRSTKSMYFYFKKNHSLGPFRKIFLVGLCVETAFLRILREILRKS